MSRRLSIIAAVTTALLGLACAGTPDTDDPGLTGPAAEETTAPPAPKGKPAPKAWGDGDYEVGKDIPAGQYATKADDDVIACTWMRVKSFDGSTGSYIAAGMVEQAATGRMVVKKSDYGVSFTGGCKWTAVK